MATKTDSIEISDAPAIPGLGFRHFRGPSDYPHMVAVIMASVEADQIEHVETVEKTANTYEHLSNSDPYQDMIIAEIDGEVIGYSRGEWFEEADPRAYMYIFNGFLAPAWRRKGIGRVMLRWMESRLRQIAAGHPADQPKFFEAFVSQHEVGRAVPESCRCHGGGWSDWKLPHCTRRAAGAEGWSGHRVVQRT